MSIGIIQYKARIEVLMEGGMFVIINTLDETYIWRDERVQKFHSPTFPPCGSVAPGPIRCPATHLVNSKSALTIIPRR